MIQRYKISGRYDDGPNLYLYGEWCKYEDVELLISQHLIAMQDLADQTGEALEAKDVEIETLKAEVSRLKEFKWMYKDL